LKRKNEALTQQCIDLSLFASVTKTGNTHRLLFKCSFFSLPDVP